MYEFLRRTADRNCKVSKSIKCSKKKVERAIKVLETQLPKKFGGKDGDFVFNEIRNYEYKDFKGILVINGLGTTLVYSLEFKEVEDANAVVVVIANHRENYVLDEGDGDRTEKVIDLFCKKLHEMAKERLVMSAISNISQLFDGQPIQVK